jgi:RNA polymerase sigma-70 factor (ECF subfamily)
VSQQEDYDVIKRVLGGDANAFEEIIQRHQSMVFAIVGKHVPSEHVAETSQEVFVRAFFALKSFRHESPFTHWLGAIATRTSAYYWRESSRREKVTLASSLSQDAAKFLETVGSNQAIANFQISSNQAAAGEILERALEDLGPLDKMVITLLYLEDKTVKEVGLLLEISIANVKIRAFRARKRLKKSLEVLMSEGEV